MASILTFDSKSMRYILGERHKRFFQSDFPLFYKNKIQKSNNQNKYYYRSAIDNALKNNQVSAIDVIIDHIVIYQNNFISSFLFQRNFSKLIEKGVKMSRVLKSEIFSFQFDYDEWPSNHTIDKTLYRGYNDSIFDLRNNYRVVFYEDDF